MKLNKELLQDMMQEAFDAGYYAAASYHNLESYPTTHDFDVWLREQAGYDLSELEAEGYYDS